MVLEPIVSSLVSHRGYDPASRIMQIRFTHKQYSLGSLYQYGNVSPELYAAGCNYIKPGTQDISFGSWFQSVIKSNPKEYPFQKLEDPSNGPEPSIGVRGKNPSPSKTCEEASSLSRDTYIPCGLTAVAQIHHKRDNVTLAMCAGCADHNVRNRGGEIFLTLNDSLRSSMDFESGAPVPVVETEILPEDIEELGARALALQETAKTIVINSGEAYRLAETTAVAITRMRDALERTMRPKIKELYEPYKAALAILNRYDGPLESDQRRLTAGMAAFKRADAARVAEESRKERERLQAIEDQKARERAEELKKADVQSALDAGETKLAKQIEKAPALPVQAKYVPPVAVASEVPQSNSSYHVEAWDYEWIDSRGDVVDHPDLSLIPQQYIIVDVKAIAAAVKRTKNRTAIPGVRPYDAGAVRLKKK